MCTHIHTLRTMRKDQLNSSGRWSKTKRLHFTVQSNKQTAQNTHTTQCKTYTLQCTTKPVSALTAHLLTMQPQDEVFGVWEWIDFRVEGFSRLRKRHTMLGAATTIVWNGFSITKALQAGTMLSKHQDTAYCSQDARFRAFGRGGHPLQCDRCGARGTSTAS